MSILNVEHVSHDFGGRTILEDASFRLLNGEHIGLVGANGEGKTTFLNALSSFIPETERVITIEDSAELQITHVPNLVRLETRNANTEGEGEITISQLIKASLRMNPSSLNIKK